MQALSGLPAQTDERILLDASGFDDAGVARLNDEFAIVQSIDFFPPVVDDPWWYGRIAAANALSDLYAMGAVPFSALNMVVFPSDELPLEVLRSIFEGGGDAVRESGAMLLGGHSVKDTGVKFGMAVTGTLKPGTEVTNAGALPGDRLYLTKPVGSGCLTTAAGKRKLSEDELAAMCESMGALNRLAAQAMMVVGVHAATDVTGFGLLGHAGEMAAGSGVDVVLSASAVPLLPGARHWMEKGFVSGGAARTLDYLGERLRVAPEVSQADQRLAADAETSGGLLIAVDPDRAEALERELEARDVLVACVGEVLAGAGNLQLRA